MAGKVDRKNGNTDCKKEREGKRVEEYRGVTLMDLLYKVYAETLANRLKAELMKKKSLSKNQIGFKKRMGTMNNIYK